ncbi:hypothetical protein M885DRAFT_210827 [Pelagophyceae sp. CCMP2097]|nr:hypothetical protein M885DRAFT_210827 [Pelagophyceae sp. CCMP2097]
MDEGEGVRLRCGSARFVARLQDARGRGAATAARKLYLPRKEMNALRLVAGDFVLLSGDEAIVAVAWPAASAMSTPQQSPRSPQSPHTPKSPGAGHADYDLQTLPRRIGVARCVEVEALSDAAVDARAVLVSLNGTLVAKHARVAVCGAAFRVVSLAADSEVARVSGETMVKFSNAESQTSRAADSVASAPPAVVVLCGPPGSGKTFALKALAAEMVGSGQVLASDVLFVDGSDVAANWAVDAEAAEATLLAALGACKVVCVDDVDVRAACSGWRLRWAAPRRRRSAAGGGLSRF